MLTSNSMKSIQHHKQQFKGNKSSLCKVIHIQKTMKSYFFFYSSISFCCLYICKLNRVEHEVCQLNMLHELRGRAVMNLWANKRKKHAIVYLLGAPPVFGAQLPQKKQINYPHRDQKTETQESYMKGEDKNTASCLLQFNTVEALYLNTPRLKTFKPIFLLSQQGLFFIFIKDHWFQLYLLQESLNTLC